MGYFYAEAILPIMVSNYIGTKMYLHNHFKQVNISYLVAISVF